MPIPVIQVRTVYWYKTGKKGLYDSDVIFPFRAEVIREGRTTQSPQPVLWHLTAGRNTGVITISLPLKESRQSV